MFGFGKSKYKAMAAEQIGGCLVRARQFGPVLFASRPELVEVAKFMPEFRKDSWLRLMTVAHLNHNLMCSLLLYRATDPAGIKREYGPVADFVQQMLPLHPELGNVALQNLLELTDCIGAPEYRDALPRRGWGRWVVINLKRESNGVYLSPFSPLSKHEQSLADAIDDFITEPFEAQFGQFYRR